MMGRKKELQEYPYRYETHCHCCWCSACARSSPQEMAEAYFQAGFSGMVLTDHFLRGNSAVDRSLPWDEKVKRYYEAYEAAKDWAAGKNFHVLFGLEHHYGDGKEVLTYGIDLPFLLEHPDIDRLPLSEYARLVHDAGGFLSMAHPYRDRGYINMSVGPQPEYLDGVEVYNFYNRPPENQKAVLLAKKHRLLPTSGGDEHSCQGASIGKSGIALKRPVSTGQELVAELKSGDYRILVDGELSRL